MADSQPVVSVKLRPPPAPSAPAASQVAAGSPEADHHGATGALGYQQPCTLIGLGAALQAGVLGWFFGFVPSMLRNRTLSAWKVWCGDGLRSAQALGLVSGLYTFTQCLCQRIRLVDDGLNRGIAGCSTGLLLGWKGGPVSALQSCAGLGIISYIVDFGSAADTPPAKAATLEAAAASGRAGSSNQGPMGSQAFPVLGQALAGAAQRARGSAHRQLHHLQHLPPVMWLGAVTQQGSAYLSGCS